MKLLDENWDTLADMLRREIEGYGRLFGLLEEQRQDLLQQDIEHLMDTNSRMEQHSGDLDGYRREREALVRNLCREADSAIEEPTVRTLIVHTPEHTTPLFEELLREVNRLIGESRRKLERNQMLLRRSHEIGRSFLRLVHPEAADDHHLYSRRGLSSASRPVVPRGHYRAQA